MSRPCLDRMPLEILHRISFFLLPDPICLRGPAIQWDTAIEVKRASVQRELAEFLPILLSCYALYNGLLPSLYKHIQLSIDTTGASELQLHKTLKFNRDLRESITTLQVHVSMPVHHLHIRSFFLWLPRIHTISIENFGNWDPDEKWKPRDLGRSPVQILYLTACSASEAALAEMLSWPKGLKELHYQADVENHGDRKLRVLCSAVERCLAFQKDHLEKFVFTLLNERHSFQEFKNVLKLQDYKCLKSLTTAVVFLTGRNEEIDVFANLPPNLEELEVTYEPNSFIGFYDYHEPRWLFGILEQKHKRLPRLQSIRAMSWFDCYYLFKPDSLEASKSAIADSFLCRRSTNLRDERWRPPVKLMEAFAAAQVCYSIFLSKRIKYRESFEGVKGFEHCWENTWPN